MAEFASAFNISDGALWNTVLERSKGQKDKISGLLRFVESYIEPENFINCFEDEVTLGDV